VFATWTGRPGAITAESRDTYRRALTPPTIAAMCADYRASFHLDRQQDSRDRAVGRGIGVPVLVVVGEDETQLRDAHEVWRSWARDLTVTRVPGGHFIPEEAPQQLAEILAAFLA